MIVGHRMTTVRRLCKDVRWTEVDLGRHIIAIWQPKGLSERREGWA